MKTSPCNIPPRYQSQSRAKEYLLGRKAAYRLVQQEEVISGPSFVVVQHRAGLLQRILIFEIPAFATDALFRVMIGVLHLDGQGLACRSGF